ncbi:group III truncated hemoglobin [Thioclava sp. 15-R06ZXC-3]|jgi:hemoglobin|uniref:Group III truncated hemoglobin n=1 Tax=Thioclava arctica TaxID=3238301 RepID=A0ABV3TK60_9RHOB
MTQPLARFDISADDIDRVVAHFYKRVRGHAMLGPVFAVHVTDWPAHEAKVAAFWKGAILREPGYDGSPMTAHRKAKNVRPGMFSGWLELFDTVLGEELAPEQAARWSALAHKIGTSLRQGVVDRETLAGGVPKLR